jgi:hypothetical protein
MLSSWVENGQSEGSKYRDPSGFETLEACGLDEVLKCFLVLFLLSRTIPNVCVVWCKPFQGPSVGWVMGKDEKSKGIQVLTHKVFQRCGL